MSHIPHSTTEDEERFVLIINQLISRKELPKSKTWEASIKDEKSRLGRKRESEKEAVEAEEMAKELGVWEEFYGNGKPKTKTRSKKSTKGGKGKDNGDEGDEGDESVLQALILKRQNERGSVLDKLAAKYAGIEEKGSGKSAKNRKRKSNDMDGVNDDLANPPDIDDETFAKLQKELFDKKEGSSSRTNARDNKKRRK